MAIKAIIVCDHKYSYWTEIFVRLGDEVEVTTSAEDLKSRRVVTSLGIPKDAHAKVHSNPTQSVLRVVKSVDKEIVKH